MVQQYNGNIEKSREVAVSLDWSRHVGREVDQTLTCAHCEHIYRDHARSAYIKEEGRFFLVSMGGCPVCTGHFIKYSKMDLRFNIEKGGGNT